MLGGSGGVEYERARYERALAAAAGGGASGSGGGGGASPTPQAAAQAFPVTLTWLKQVLQEVSAPTLLVLRCHGSLSWRQLPLLPPPWGPAAPATPGRA